MGVQSNQYLIYGAKLNYEDYKGEEWYEKFEPFMDSAFDEVMNPGGLTCLFDGMNGNYIIIGRVIKKSTNLNSIEYFKFTDVNKELAEMTRLLVKAELGIEEEIVLHLVTHYS